MELGQNPKPGSPEYEWQLGYEAREELRRIKAGLIREHANGHRELGEFCPICQQSPKS